MEFKYLMSIIKTLFTTILTVFFFIGGFSQTTKNIQFDVVTSNELTANINDWKYNESFFLSVNNNSTKIIEAKPFIKLEDAQHTHLTNLNEDIVLSFEPKENKLVNGKKFLNPNSVNFRKLENNKTYYLIITLEPIDKSVSFETKNYRVSCKNNYITLIDLDQTNVKKEEIDIKNIFLAKSEEQYNYSFNKKNYSTSAYNSNNNAYNSKSSSSNNSFNNNNMNEELIAIISQLSSILGKVIEPVMKNFEKIETYYSSNEVIPSKNSSSSKTEESIKNELENSTNTKESNVKITTKKLNSYPINIIRPKTEEIINIKKQQTLNSNLKENTVIANKIISIELKTIDTDWEPDLNNIASSKIEEKNQNYLFDKKVEEVITSNLTQNKEISSSHKALDPYSENNEDDNIKSVYKVEFLKLRNNIVLDLSFYPHLEGYEVFYSDKDNQYHYYIGSYDSKIKASEFLDKIQQKHVSAKLVFDGNQTNLFTYID